MSDPPLWDVQRMRPVVTEWDEALRADLAAYARLLPEAEERGSVLRPAAGPEAIAAIEDRLAVQQLPPSYRSFLSLADGADAAGSRAGRVLRGVAATEEQILRAEKVVAFADDEFLSWLVNMWHENFHPFTDRQLVPGDEPVAVFDFEPGVRGLLITAPVQDGTVALVPTGPEWQVWEFFHSDVRAHRSFADFLAFQAREARTRVARRAERVRELDLKHMAFGDVELLAAHGDPRAIEAASTWLLDPGVFVNWKDTAARTLGFIGDPTAIPALRASLARVGDPGFAVSPRGLRPDAHDEDVRRLRLALMKALDLCGDTESLDDLARLSQEEPPVAEYAARYLAQRDELPRW